MDPAKPRSTWSQVAAKEGDNVDNLLSDGTAGGTNVSELESVQKLAGGVLEEGKVEDGEEGGEVGASCVPSDPNLEPPDISEKDTRADAFTRRKAGSQRERKKAQEEKALSARRKTRRNQKRQSAKKRGLYHKKRAEKEATAERKKGRDEKLELMAEVRAPVTRPASAPSRVRRYRPPRTPRIRAARMAPTKQKKGRVKPLTMEEIRDSIVSAVQTEAAAPKSEPPPSNEALHAFAMCSRPSTAQEVRDTAACVCAAVQSCGGDPNLLKVFLLCACRRRYHAKAPEAKATLRLRVLGPGDGGDGERLIFYIAVLTLYQMGKKGVVGATEGCHALVSLAYSIGGSRDTNFLLVHLLYDEIAAMSNSPLLEMPRGTTVVSRAALVSAVRRVCVWQELESEGVLRELLQSTAQKLDEDLLLVSSCNESSTPVRLMSTQHVFMPHRGRGNKEGSSWRRRLVNATAELLIWQHTQAASREERFREAMAAFVSAVDERAESMTPYQQILKMQTSTRKFLQTLNSHARSQGFQLCSLYRLDPTAITFRMVRHGKAADVQLLRSIAKSAGDTRVLWMLAKRGLTATNAVHAESVSDLINHIKEVGSKGESKDGDEISVLERQILRQTIQATLTHLRRSITKESRPKVCVCLDNDVPNQVCAALIAAAFTPSCRLDEDAQVSSLAPPCRLSLPCVQSADVSSFDLFVALLQTIVSGGEDRGGELQSPEEAVREVGPGQDVLLFASYSVQMDAVTLESLRRRDCTIRAHNVSLYLQKGEVRDIGPVEEVHLDLGSGTGSILCGACVMMQHRESLPDGPKKVVHFSDRVSPDGAVRHSGDTTDENGHSCHTIDADLRGLSPGVNALWFTLCSCGCDHLGKFDEPRIRFVNQKTGAPLCEYRLQKAGAAKSVVMAVMTRSPNDPRRWSVQAVGGSEAESQQRCCMNYSCMDPIFKSLKDLGIGQPSQNDVAEAAPIFERQNVAAVSSSVGGEISKLCQLCRVEGDHEEVKQVKSQLESAQKSEKRDEREEAPVDFQLTSHDVLLLQLSRLPPVCQSVINSKLGITSSLIELAATNIANQLRESGQTLEEIRDALPDDLVEHITTKLANFGV